MAFISVLLFIKVKQNRQKGSLHCGVLNTIEALKESIGGKDSKYLKAKISL